MCNNKQVSELYPVRQIYNILAEQKTQDNEIILCEVYAHIIRIKGKKQ